MRPSGREVAVRRRAARGSSATSAQWQCRCRKCRTHTGRRRTTTAGRTTGRGLCTATKPIGVRTTTVRAEASAPIINVTAAMTETTRAFMATLLKSAFRSTNAPTLASLTLGTAGSRRIVTPVSAAKEQSAAVQRDTGRQLAEVSVERFPVPSCTSTQSEPFLNSWNRSGRPRSRPSSRAPVASRAARSMISTLSRVNASSAIVTGAPFSAVRTVPTSSARVSAVGCVMIAGTS